MEKGREREGKRRVREGRGRGQPPKYFGLEPPLQQGL